MWASSNSCLVPVRRRRPGDRAGCGDLVIVTISSVAEPSYMESPLTIAPPAAFTLHDVIATWRGISLTERAASQSHFIDLSRLVGEPAPTDVDPTGSS
jgi:hypothetical protein